MPGIGAVYIGTRISPATFARLEKIAAREQNYISAVVRRLLAVGLAAEDEARATRGRARKRRAS